MTLNSVLLAGRAANVSRFPDGSVSFDMEVIQVALPASLAMTTAYLIKEGAFLRVVGRLEGGRLVVEHLRQEGD